MNTETTQPEQRVLYRRDDRHAELDYVSRLNDCMISDGRDNSVYKILVVHGYKRSDPSGLPDAITYRTRDERIISIPFQGVIDLIRRGQARFDHKILKIIS